MIGGNHTQKGNAPGGFILAPAGVYFAYCVRVIDLGTRPNRFKDNAMTRQLSVTWELHSETGCRRPLLFSEFVTYSLGEKSNLRKWLTSWRGREFSDAEAGNFDLNAVVGKPCILSLIEKNGQPKISAIIGIPKIFDIRPIRVNPLVYFSLNSFEAADFEKLSPGIRRMVTESREYQGYIRSAA